MKLHAKRKVLRGELRKENCRGRRGRKGVTVVQGGVSRPEEIQFEAAFGSARTK